MPALSNRLGQLAPYPFVEISRIIAEKRAAGARAQHGIADPAGHLSAALGINPPFTPRQVHRRVQLAHHRTRPDLRG